MNIKFLVLKLQIYDFSNYFKKKYAFFYEKIQKDFFKSSEKCLRIRINTSFQPIC
jgi:hypothetical protein